MDDFYNIAANPDPKHGLGLLASDLETFQFPTLCGDFDQDQLLALDDPHSFYLTFPDIEVLGAEDESTSRSSTVVTPQSECSTRTTLSATNTSPTSDIVTFRDKNMSQDIEAMYYDTTQSIISGRVSRAPSVSWQNMGQNAGLNSTLTPPARSMSHRPQSFSYRGHQMSSTENSHTPPPPSSFFPSPNIPPQTTPVPSPYLSPNLHSPMIQQVPQVASQNAFGQATMPPDSTSYFSQVQPLPPQHLQQHFQQQLQFQQQTLGFPPQQQQQQQNWRPNSQYQPAPIPLKSDHHLTAVFPHQMALQSPPLPLQPFNNISNPSDTASTTPPTLPNTTGNSSTGYQCFSHGCGGRHFSNWGNLVRHHRERQLRSKAGAKPTCPRCGKGFTRSSARDAHVAGLKCVLGRRRRGGGSAAAAAAAAAGTATATSTTSGSGSGTVAATATEPGAAELASTATTGSIGKGVANVAKAPGQSLLELELELQLDAHADDGSSPGPRQPRARAQSVGREAKERYAHLDQDVSSEDGSGVEDDEDVNFDGRIFLDDEDEDDNIAVLPQAQRVSLSAAAATATNAEADSMSEFLAPQQLRF